MLRAACSSLNGAGNETAARLNGTGAMSIKGTIIPTADVPEVCSDTNVWAEADFRYVAGDRDTTGNNALATMGVEHLLNDALLVGLRASLDYTDVSFGRSSLADSDISGYGWFAVPPVNAQVCDRVRSFATLLDGLGHHVGGVMTNKFERTRIGAGDDLDPAVDDGVGQVTHGAVEGNGDSLFGKRLGNRFSDLSASRAGSVFADRTIGESERYGSGHAMSPDPVPPTNAGGENCGVENPATNRRLIG